MESLWATFLRSKRSEQSIVKLDMILFVFGIRY